MDRKMIYLMVIFLNIFLIYNSAIAGQYNEEIIKNYLAKEMNNINKVCPITVDKYTMLVSTGTFEKTFIFNYRLTSDRASEVSDNMKDFLKEQGINGYCTAMGDLAFFRNNSITLVLNYRDIEGVFISSILIEPTICKNRQ